MADRAVYQLILEGVSESADALAAGEIQRQIRTTIIAELGISVDELRHLLCDLPAVLKEASSPEELKSLYDTFTNIGACVYIAKEAAESFAPLPIEEPVPPTDDLLGLDDATSKIVPLSDDAVYLSQRDAPSPFSLSLDAEAGQAPLLGSNYQTVSKEDVGKQVNRLFSELERQKLIRDQEDIEELNEPAEQASPVQRQREGE